MNYCILYVFFIKNKMLIIENGKVEVDVIDFGVVNTEVINKEYKQLGYFKNCGFHYVDNIYNILKIGRETFLNLARELTNYNSFEYKTANVYYYTRQKNGKTFYQIIILQTKQQNLEDFVFCSTNNTTVKNQSAIFA